MNEKTLLMLKEGGLQPSSASSINISTAVKGSVVGTISNQIGNANNTPTEYLDMVKNHVTNIVKNPIEMNAEFEHSQIELFKIDIGNFKTAAVVVRSSTSLFDDNDNGGRIRWNFSGENILRTVTLRVGERMWQEEFARLRSPISSLLPDKNNLKTTAHQIIYEELCTILTPVDKSTLGNTVIFQGASGLGKTYCAQHYFYHESAQQHQMVAWLNGTTKEAFLRGWSAVAQQLRNVQVGNSEISDDAIIQDWCENKLGQWLLIIDEVDIDAAWLAERLPRKGGHVVITTHRPQYQLHQGQAQVTLQFLPLSREDSQQLLQMHVGPYWQASGHPEEQKALDYLGEALGGFPVALTQVALLAHKKCLSFERLAQQFKQPTLRTYLLNDAVYNQLKNRTFIDIVQKGWQQLLAYLKAQYPLISEELHEQNLNEFIKLLAEKTSKSEAVTSDWVREYWQAIGVLHSLDKLINWLKCLPLSYKSDTQEWHFSLTGISTLKNINDREASAFPSILLKETGLFIKDKFAQKIPTFLKDLPQVETEDSPVLPENMQISVSLKDSMLKCVEVAIATVNLPNKLTAWQLPKVNPHFILRQKLIDELLQKLPSRKTGEASIELLLTAVTGLGGMGKTELARYYVTNDDTSAHYGKRFWFTAVSDTMLRMQFQQLAAYQGLIDLERYIEDEKLIHYVHTWLKNEPGWVMVLDNADDYNSIAHWIPKEGGAVLITTRERNPGVLSQAQIISIPLLEDNEAIQWLYQLSNRSSENLSEEEKEVAKNLVKKLGPLPLAIAQAAAYLKSQPKVSIADYLADFMNLLNDTTLAQQQHIPESDGYYRLIIANTWALSLRAIEAYVESLNLPNIAEPLLNVCAHLASKDIPIVLLERWLENIISEENFYMISYIIDEYIGQLIRYSLIERNDEDNTISISGLVQDVFRYQQTSAEKIFHLKEMCSTSDSLIIKNDGLDSLLDRRLLPHIECLFKNSESYSNWLETDAMENASSNWKIFPKELVRLYQNFGLAKKGLDLSQKMETRSALCFGQNNIITLNIQQGIAAFLSQLDRHSEAEAIFSNLLAIFQGQPRRYHPLRLAVVQENLAIISEYLGDYSQAEKLCRQALDVIKIYCTVKTPIRVARAQQNLANSLQLLGDYSQAKKMYDEALDEIEKYYKNSKHIRVVEAQQNYANLLMSMGDYKEARRIFYEALPIVIAHYQTEQHICVAMVQQNLANACMKCGDISQAKDLYDKSSILLKNYYDSIEADKSYASIRTAEIRQNKAVSLQKLGDYISAQTLYLEVIEIKKNYYKRSDHVSIARTQQNLASAFQQGGDFLSAKSHYLQAIEIMENSNTDQRISVAVMRQNLAIVFKKLGDTSQAIILYNQAIDVMKIFYNGEFHIDIANTQQNLANILEEKGDYLQAEDLYRKSIATKISYYENEIHIDVALTKTNLAQLLVQVGNLNQASELLQVCESIFQSQPGGEQYLPGCRKVTSKILVVVSLEKLANEALALGRYKEAISGFDVLITLCKAYPKFYHNGACAYHLFGIQQNNQLFFDKAKTYFERSLLLKKGIGAQVEYANFLKARGNYIKALALLNNLLEQNMEDDSGGLTYSIGEAIALPHFLFEKIRVEGDITIKNSIFFAHYLKIMCLLEKHAIEPATISVSLNEFAGFVNSAKNNRPDTFLPIYDWFLQNARELANQSAATFIQRFFRRHITKKNLIQNEIKLDL